MSISPEIYFRGLHTRIQNLYSGHDDDCNCPHCATHTTIKLGLGDNILSALLNAAKSAFNHIKKVGKYKPEDLELPVFKRVIDETFKVFKTAVTDNDMPETMRRALESDLFLFGGLKTHAQMTEAFSLIKDGARKSFDQLAKELDDLNNTYNRNWLEAEYNFATASAQMAANWSKLDDTGRYNLQYRTALDDRVRVDHAALEGTTLPNNDPFWRNYYPPNGWNCRCTAVEVLKDDYPESDSAAAQLEGETATTQIGKNGENKLKIFRFNPGIDMKVMPPEHPYNKVVGATAAGKVVETQYKKFLNNRVLNKPREEQFETVYEIKNGKVKGHLLTVKKDDYPDILTAAKLLAEKGGIVETMPEINKIEVSIRRVVFPNLSSNRSNPDLRSGNKYYDIKRPTEFRNILKRANEASNQGAIAIISDSRMRKPLTDKIIEERTKAIFQSKYYNFNQVIFLRDNQLIIKNRTGE